MSEKEQLEDTREIITDPRFQQWMDIQAKEAETALVTAQSQVEISKDKTAYAQTAITLRADSYNKEVNANAQGRRETKIFVTGIIAVVLFFIAYCISHDSKDIALEVIKAMMYLGGGALGGYGYGVTRCNKNPENDD